MVLTQQFGDIQVPVPGFGAMGISFGLGNNLTLEQAEPVLLKALELGCTFWDTAVRQNHAEHLFPLENTDFLCLRSYTKPASTRSSSEISSGNTTCAIRFYVCAVLRLPISDDTVANHPYAFSRLQVRFRRFRRRRRHQLARTHQVVHRWHDRAFRLCARSLLPPPH